MLVEDGLVDDLPQMFGGLKFRRVGGQEDEPDSLGNLQVGLSVPAGVVEDENDDAVAPGSGLFGEGRQQRFEERLRDAVGNVPETFAGRGRDEGRDIEPFKAMMTMSDGAHAYRRPDAARDRLQPEPMLVGREGFDRKVRMRLRLLGDDVGKFFLKLSCSASLAAFGLRGRGACIDHPSAFSASQPR